MTFNKIGKLSKKTCEEEKFLKLIRSMDKKIYSPVEDSCLSLEKTLLKSFPPRPSLFSRHGYKRVHMDMESYYEIKESIGKKIYLISENNLRILLKLLKKYEEKKDFEAYRRFIESLKDMNSSNINLLLANYRKIKRIFGKLGDDVVYYIIRNRKNRLIYRINDIERELEIGKELRKISIKNSGKRTIENLIKLCYMLNLLYESSINVSLDPNKNLKENISMVEKEFEKEIMKMTEKMKRMLNLDEDKERNLSSLLEEDPLNFKRIIEGKIEKFGIEDSFEMGELEFYLNPKDLVSQLYSLHVCPSCLSPGNTFFFSFTRNYLRNPYVFFGIIRKNKEIVGRFLVFTGYGEDGKLSIARVSRVYSRENYRKNEDLEDMAEKSVKMYAMKNGLEYLKEGRICVPNLKEAYGDYLIPDPKRRKINGVETFCFELDGNKDIANQRPFIL